MKILIKKNKHCRRVRRHHRIRGKIKGTKNRPRLSVFRSNKHIYAQIINDELGHTLVGISDVVTIDKDDQQKIKPIKTAYRTGELIAEKALKKGIKQVVFDRGGYLYHGRVKALAEGARNKGLEF